MKRVLVRLSPLVAAAILATGCAAQPSPEPTEQTGALASADTTASAVDVYGLDWVVEPDDGSLDTIRADISIPVSPDVVWSLLRDPNGWGRWNSAITASVPTMAPGEPISLDIRIFPWPIPPTSSMETVYVFDDTLHAESWTRSFGVLGSTIRWQLVVPEGNGAHYYSALKEPFLLALGVDVTVRSGVHHAFVEFAEALRAESIRVAQGSP
jgi:hypothetical protein